MHPSILTRVLRLAASAGLAVFLLSRGGPQVAAAPAMSDNPPNPVVAENCRPGTADWAVTRPLGDIEGFASPTSIAPGESLQFRVNTDAPTFNLDIYRTGYYGGAGARLIDSITNLPGQAQPDCRTDPSVGLTSCANWSISHTLTVPDDWVSGVYVARFTRPDTGGQAQAMFVVRDDSRQAPIFYPLALTTYQAYNWFGGKSLYSVSSGACRTVAEAPRAVKVSLDRPLALSVPYFNTYQWADFPMVYWLESQGYDVSYGTSLDVHQAGKAGVPNTLLQHQIILVAGHDEYWSSEMRDAVMAARDAGVNLAFLSSNVSYWRIRLEPDPWTGEADRVIVSYKTTESGGPDPSGVPTGTWRDPEGSNDPENELVGIQYVGDNDIRFFPLRVTAEHAADRLYRYTDLQAMPPGTYADIGRHIIGWEWDAVTDNGRTPDGITVLAETPVFGSLLTDHGGAYELGTTASHVTRYVAPSGAIVFAAGTNLWPWGLALVEPDSRLQQMTVNLLADMGVQPTTPARHIQLDEAPAGNDEASLGENTSAAGPDDNFGNAIRDALASMDLDVTPRDEEVSSSTVARPVPTQGGPTLSPGRISIAGDAATIEWETDVPSSGQAWIWREKGRVDWSLANLAFGQLPSLGDGAHETPSLSHSISIDGLDASSTYYYQIAATDADGRTTIAPPTALRTPRGSVKAEAQRLLRPAYQRVRCEIQTSGPAPIGMFVMAAMLCLGVASYVAYQRWAR